MVSLTGIPKNSVSRAVAKLMADGLLVRKEHEADRRKGVLAVTAKGRKVFDSILPKFVARQERMLAVLTPVEQREFDRLLNKLVERSDDWAAEY